MAYIQNVDEIVQVTPTEDYPEIYLSQNENGRVLRLYVAGDDFPSGSTATFSGTKPDGVVFSTTGTVSGNTVTVNENIQMTAVAGTWFAKLKIINGGNTLSTIKIKIIVDADPVKSGVIPSNSELDGIIAEAQQYAEDARSAAYGSPLTASTASAMTDKTKVYVYTGSESGYTAGHWYYWNGSAWTDGGVYNAVAVQTDKTLTIEDKAADAKATGYAIDNRNAPSADQLISDNYTIDQTPYLYRQTNSNGADRAIEEIVGGSAVWNQLCNGTSVTVTSGHKYMLKKGTAWSIGSSTGTAITGLTSGSDMVCDLTQMFGTTIADYIYSLEQSRAGAGVAFFRKLFPEDYYAYDAGTMRHVSGVSAKETVGKNLLNMTASSSVSNGVSFNVNKDGSISLSGTASANTYFYFGDTQLSDIKNGNYILSGCPSGGSYSKYGIQINHNGAWLFDYGSGVSIQKTGALSSIGIRIASGTNVNGLVFKPMLRLASVSDATFEPYTKHTYPLDSSLTLRGIPKLDSNNQLYFDGDTYAADGTVTRKYGIVDLGTLNWTYHAPTSTLPYGYFDYILYSMKNFSNASEVANIFCGNYRAATSAQVAKNGYDKTIAVGGQTIFIADSGYTTAASFKSAMSGVYLVYELATPTTETAEPYTNPQICDPYGTEEFISTSLVPVGHYTKYPENLRAKLENLDLSMIAPIETGTTASQAYAVGKYFLLNNKFCKAKTAIASGATFTLNTNYTVTTIADELYTALH